MTQSSFEVPQGMSLAGTLDVSVWSKFEVPQGMLLAGILDASVSLINALTLSKFDVLRECRSPAHSMFQ